MPNKYEVEPGKIFKSKIDGTYLSNVIYLGCEDSIDNYEQVDASEAEELYEEEK
jgi:hypothetical protein